MTNEEKTIIDGVRIQALLDDPEVQKAFGALKHDAYQDFLKATTNEQRVAAQARHQAIERLEDKLKVIARNGAYTSNELRKKGVRRDLQHQGVIT